MDQDGPISVAGLVRGWRVEVAGMNASNVAAPLGVGRSSVANWESGLRTPGAETLAALDGLYKSAGAPVDLAAALGSSQRRCGWPGHGQEPAVTERHPKTHA